MSGPPAAIEVTDVRREFRAGGGLFAQELSLIHISEPTRPY